MRATHIRHADIKNAFIILSFISYDLHADIITIINERATKTMFCAQYYKKDKKAERAGEIIAIAPSSEAKKRRLSRKIFYDRELVCAENQLSLGEKLTAKDLSALHAHNIGTLKGSSFFIHDEGSAYLVSSAAKQKNVTEFLASETLKILLKKRYGNKFRRHPSIAHWKQTFRTFEQQQARVRLNAHLSSGEEKAIVAHDKNNERTLAAFLSQDITNGNTQQLPRIALVFSGGGYRAMTMTLGWLTGAERDNLLACVTWIAVLSGSSWAVGPWISSDKTIEDFRSSLFEKIANTSLAPSRQDSINTIVDDLVLPLISHKKPTIVSAYGSLLGNRLMGAQEEKTWPLHYAFDQRTHIDSGALPIPIFATIIANPSYEKVSFEITPFDSGSQDVEAFIDTWALGRTFNRGISINNVLPINLPFILACAGSAFALNVADIYEFALKEKISDRILQTALSIFVKGLAKTRISVGKVPNFLFGIQERKLPETDNIALIDAAFKCNIPLDLVMGKRRTADIVIIGDASSGELGEELYKAFLILKDKGVPMPYFVDEQGNKHDFLSQRKPLKKEFLARVRTSSCAILYSPDNGPVYVYMPRFNDPNLWQLFDTQPTLFGEYKKDVRNFDIEKCTNEEMCSTFNLTYSRDIFNRLSKSAEFQIRANMEKIRQEIRRKIHKSLRRNVRNEKF